MDIFNLQCGNFYDNPVMAGESNYGSGRNTGTSVCFLRLYRLLPDDRRWKEKTVYNAEQKGAICMVWLTVFAVALLTSMSYILSTVMIGCFGFVYGIAKKSLRTAIMVWGTCLVNIAYLGISTLLH